MKIQGYMNKPEDYPVVAKFDLELVGNQFPVAVVKTRGAEHRLVDIRSRKPLFTFITRKRRSDKLIEEAKDAFEQQVHRVGSGNYQATINKFLDLIVSQKIPDWVAADGPQFEE